MQPGYHGISVKDPHGIKHHYIMIIHHDGKVKPATVHDWGEDRLEATRAMADMLDKHTGSRELAVNLAGRFYNLVIKNNPDKADWYLSHDQVDAGVHIGIQDFDQEEWEACFEGVAE